MKTAKLLKRTGVSVFALAIFASSVVPAFAVGKESGDKNVPVTYESNIIPDPDKPEAPTWGVTVPSKIAFNDEHMKETDVDVELVGMNGSTLNDLNPTFRVEVYARSMSGMVLQEAGKDNLAYTLEYGGIFLNKKETVTIATLGKDAPKKSGVATLTQKALEKGAYTDTLVYKIKKTVD